MTISNEQEEIILKTYGEKRYSRAKLCIDIYAEKWKLKDLTTIQKPSRNLVLTCDSQIYGPCVLKVGFDNISSEIEVLRLFNGHGYCRLFEDSINDGVCLIEQIMPGNDLFDNTTRNDRGCYFSTIYNTWNSVSTKPIDLSIFPSFLSLFENEDSDVYRSDNELLASYTNKAKELILHINSIYSPSALLHGDLAYSNILKNKNNEYTAIDPIGIAGAAVFSISQFILNEFGNAMAHETLEGILKFIELLAKKVNIPIHILKECLYVEAVLRLCQLEYSNGKTLKDYKHMIDNISVAERIMGL